MLSNLLVNGQIHTRNLQGLAERDLPYIAYACAKKNLEWWLKYLQDLWVLIVVKLESNSKEYQNLKLKIET